MDNFILNNSNSEADLGILKFLEDVENKKSIVFTTSGTTGEPKSVVHSYDSIVKNIKINKDLQKSIWGLTYDYSKIAASQVILQSYLNDGKIVNLFGKNYLETIDLIEKYKITHISATPTFYRMLCNQTFNQVRQVTLGGESVDSLVISQIKKTFPNAKLTNIYALTEFGTLFSSDNEYFCLSESKSKIIRIENHRILVKEDKEWIDTGDLVEWKDDKNFKIVGRESSIINVGGYKINPIKIESVINSLDYVRNSKVYGLDNSVTGKIVVADIIATKEIEKREILNDLKSYLNKYEIPLKINIVDQIQTNSTGKIIRN